nr:uncharacterized mitochondrial protein AtMg00810-like [Tanacetum cinerariifolium]
TNRVNVASAHVTAVGPNPTNSTNSFNAASPSDNVVNPNFEIGRKSSFMDPSQYPDDPNMPALKDIFYSDDEEDVEVYVCQPPRFEDPDYPDKVYKVVKALYGSHQALRAWNVDSPSKFLMYQRFLQLMINPRVDDLSSHTTKYTSPALTQKVFANMRRIDKGFSGVETLLFATMLVQPQAVAEEEGDDDEVSAALTPP